MRFSFGSLSNTISGSTSLQSKYQNLNICSRFRAFVSHRSSDLREIGCWSFVILRKYSYLSLSDSNCVVSHLSKRQSLCFKPQQAFYCSVMDTARCNDGQAGRKKHKKSSEEASLRHDLDMICKRGDAVEALKFYDHHKAAGTFNFLQYHYNILLHLCAAFASNAESEDSAGKSQILPPKDNGSGTQTEEVSCTAACTDLVTQEMKDEVIQRGKSLLAAMEDSEIAKNEATLTSAARLAAAEGNGSLAFDYVLQMERQGVEPKLRSYGPALFTFCSQADSEGAFRVFAHLQRLGVEAGEEELAALLQLSVTLNLELKVYELLHELRRAVRELKPETLSVIERWFKSSSPLGKVAGVEGFSAEEAARAEKQRGGGWHGLGWIGAGPWEVQWSEVSQDSVCSSCGGHLVTIDLDPQETADFAVSVSRLASEREAQKNEFQRFEAWLDQHGPFDAVVDAANVALNKQNFDGGGFNFAQLSGMIDRAQGLSESGRLPLVILHNRRTRGGPADSPFARSLLRKLTTANCFYATPRGSNDDWYWLFAAVKFKAYLVTNDEMRDHLFQLLGRDFFPRWKERHQVRYSFSTAGMALHLPPPYSVVTQESACGSWHFPMANSDLSEPRKWLCAARSSSTS